MSMSDSFIHLTRLPEDALVLVFQYLPPATHAQLCTVCHDWYHSSTYPDIFGVLLSHRIRYWIDWMIAQPKSEQTLAHLLSAHPILESTMANQFHEVVELAPTTHPTSHRTTTQATLATTDKQTRHVTIQSAQLLNLVEIICSGFRSSIRQTRESHTHSLTGDLVQPLQTFAIQQLDLSHYPFIDTPLCRALTHLPAITTLNLSSCKLLSDASVGTILSHPFFMSHLSKLDLSYNKQLSGKGWFEAPPTSDTESLVEPIASSSLTWLNLSGCTLLSPTQLTSKFFSPEFLAPLKFLGLSGNNSKMLLMVLKTLGMFRDIECFLFDDCAFNVTPGELSLLRSGRFRTNPFLTLEMALLEEDFNISGGVRGTGEESNPIVPLAHLRKIDFSNVPGLTDEVLGYLQDYFAPHSLESLSLASCIQLTSNHVREFLQHIHGSIQVLDLTSVELDDDDLLILQQDSSLSFSSLTSLNLTKSSASSFDALFLFLQSGACPNLRTLTLRRLSGEVVTRPTLADIERSQREREEQRAIEEHARAKGLTLPSSPTATSSSVSSNEEKMDSSLDLFRFGTNFGRAIAAQRNLLELDLSDNPDLTDQDLNDWIQAAEQVTTSDAASASSSSFIHPSTIRSQIISLNLSGCSRITSTTVARLMEVITSGRDQTMIQLIANHCEGVHADELEAIWQRNQTCRLVQLSAESFAL